MSESLTLWRTRARWFAAEFLVIVTGVLVALGLNALYQRGQDARNETTYLALLDRDIGHSIRQLEEKIGFEAAQVGDGMAAYRSLSGPAGTENRAVVSAALSKLVDRRTMVLREATYQDLLSTGNLRLIRNRHLRDRIVDYYETTRAEYDIMNRNNAYLVDQIYVPMVIGQGLINVGSVPGNTALLRLVDEALLPKLRPGYIEQPDYLWSLPANGQAWAEVRAGLLLRIRVSAISEQFARQVLARTRALSGDLEAERKR
jgi:hypothetical protein